MMPSRTKHGLLGAVAAAVIFAPFVFSDAQVKPAAPSPGPTLTVPSGFEIERVAGPPLVDRPIVADFDDQGRLYVADSSGSNDPVKQQLTDLPHRIVRLEDKNGDGRFDTSVVFADKMMFPEGTMWFDGSLYVAAPPSIWKLTDTNGDGVADQREEWFQAKTLTNCANDLHGPYLGPDGFIYWTKGAFAQQTYERAGKPPFVTRASHIFRRRPGDAAVEPVMTGGMDNPVDVAFTPSGERILTATFLEHPQLGRRDALVHAVYGGVYGKPHAVLDGHRRTGELMPVMVQFGPAVPAGLTRYDSQIFGREFRDNFFAAMFNLRKVTRHVLEPNGATFRSRDADFVVSQDRDFHPTDVIEDADGSLLVIDTGPWYKLCCPTSQLAKPDVFGAIYRVRRKGAPGVRDPRGLRLAWDRMPPNDLAALLDDSRPAVRNRALRQFARLQGAAVPALAGVVSASRSADARRNAIWGLTRIDSGQARDVVRQAIADRDESVRQTAIYSAGTWRDANALPALVSALQSNVPAIQRSAAEALGRIGNARVIDDLLRIAATPIDRVLEHSLTYALIEIANPEATLAVALHTISPGAKRVALIAVDQMEGGGLPPDALIPALESRDAALRDAAWWIASRHPEWGGALAGYFHKRLNVAPPTLAEREDLVQKLSQLGDHTEILVLLASTIELAPSKEARETALRAMAAIARTRLKELPLRWVDPLTRTVSAADLDAARQALAILRAVPAKQGTALTAALLRVANDPMRPADVRLDALAAMQGDPPKLGAELFALLRASVDPEQPAPIRLAAAGVIEKARLDRAQLLALAESVEKAGPLELPRILPAFDQSKEEQVGMRLLAALEKSRSRASIHRDMLRPRLAKYPPAVQARGEALLASLTADTAKQAAHLEELLAGLGAGDIRRGQAVFNSPKAACMTCHAIGYMGGRVGPDLTRIGQVRSERDLLEAIVYPSVSFARGYESVTVTTTTGEVHGGVIRSDQPDALVLATAAGAEIRLARERVKDVQPGTVSLMPPGLDAQLTRQELADLLAFLKATRSGAN